MVSTRGMSRGHSRTRRAERTRSEILEAAAVRFAELGFEGTRLEDVGEDVGIGRSAILYHFKDKRQLYRAVLDGLFGELLAQLRAALTTPGALERRLESAVRVSVAYFGRRPLAARLAMRESVSPDPALREEIRAQARPFLALLEALFAEGERSGAFRPVRSDPLHFASSVAGATLFYVAALPTVVSDLPYDPLSREQLEAHERDVLDITRRLLGTRGPRSVGDRRGPSRPRSP